MGRFQARSADRFKNLETFSKLLEVFCCAARSKKQRNRSRDRTDGPECRTSVPNCSLLWLRQPSKGTEQWGTIVLHFRERLHINNSHVSR